MAKISYARPRLTTPDDHRYREHVAQFMMQRSNQRAMRPPQQRDIFGGQAEKALRGWLAATYELSDRRILEYEQRQHNRATMKYRELDAVVFDDKRTISVFEIKASRATQSIRRAVAQLQETRAILRLLYPTVRATILFVNTDIPSPDDPIVEPPDRHPPDDPVVEPPDRHPPNDPIVEPPSPQDPDHLISEKKLTSETLEHMLAVHPTIQQIFSLEDRHHDGTKIDLLIFQVEDIIALVGEENLALDWSVDEQPVDGIAQPVEPTPVLSSLDDGEDDHGGALAEALRRAGFRP